MSDWDFLHEMRDLGYSAQDIADAAGCGLAPWDLDKAWIDSELEDQTDDDVESIEEDASARSRAGHPLSTLKQIEILYDLVDCAKRHWENTGRYLQIWGELGEIYAEIKFNLCRHESHRAGSDGTISGKLVEVKTISPEKTSNLVRVKSIGDFEQLLIVRISPDFTFRGKLFDRSQLNGASGKFMRARLDDDRAED